MILQTLELKVKVTWLDPENVNKGGRRLAVANRIRELFENEFGKTTNEKHGVKIELVEAH